MGLPGPYDAFTLAPGVAASGAIAVADALALVLAAWRADSVPVGFTDATLRRYEHNLVRFAAYVTAMGFPMLADLDAGVCADWVHARPTGKMWASNTTGQPAYGTQANRRTSLINFFATCHQLGLWDENPAEKVTTHGRSNTRTRPLTEAEAARLMDRAAYQARENKMPATVALALAGATVTEIAQVEPIDVYLAEQVVWLPGLGRRNLARWVPLDEWQADALASRINYLTRRNGSSITGFSLVHRGRVADQDPTKFAMTTNQMLVRALAKAGLGVDQGVRPSSIHEYVANRVYTETGSMEAVAVRCGLRSIDAAARLVTVNWRTTHETPAPAGACESDRYAAQSQVEADAR
ncbi:MAG: Integrase family protein [Nocardioides sp.]|nr:Integrase family protein [Nocardioides sp.]